MELPPRLSSRDAHGLDHLGQLVGFLGEVFCESGGCQRLASRARTFTTRRSWGTRGLCFSPRTTEAFLPQASRVIEPSAVRAAKPILLPARGDCV